MRLRWPPAAPPRAPHAACACRRPAGARSSPRVRPAARDTSTVRWQSSGSFSAHIRQSVVSAEPATSRSSASCELRSPGQRLVARAVLGLAAQRRTLVTVEDAGRRQALRQALAAELREAARVGRGAHIDHRLDAARLQEVDEALDRMVGMADRLDHAAIKRSPALGVKQMTVSRYTSGLRAAGNATTLGCIAERAGSHHALQVSENRPVPGPGRERNQHHLLRDLGRQGRHQGPAGLCRRAQRSRRPSRTSMPSASRSFPR